MHIDLTNFAALWRTVPEAASLVLFGSALAALAARLRRVRATSRTDR
jgi:hypothetical protein